MCSFDTSGCATDAQDPSDTLSPECLDLGEDAAALAEALGVSPDNGKVRSGI